MGDLSKHFDRTEFTCKCGCGFCKPDPKLIEGLERIRELAGGLPVKVTSGCRCRKHNSTIPGHAKDSQHTYGRAADIKIKGTDGNWMSASALIHLAEMVPQFNKGGIGRYTNRIHVDIRSNGPARWGGA